MNHKKCTKCNLLKEVSNFSKSLTKIRSACKKCCNEYNKKYYKFFKQNPDKFQKLILQRRECVKRYSLKNKEKQKIIIKRYVDKKKEKLEISLIKTRFEILKKYNFTCQYCGRKAPNVQLHIDHIIPKSKGGENIKSNLTVACIECNEGKSDILLND